MSGFAKGPCPCCRSRVHENGWCVLCKAFPEQQPCVDCGGYWHGPHSPCSRWACGANHAGDLCFRCQTPLDPDPKHGHFHSATITIEHADASYAGEFKLGLCYKCVAIPHQDDYERVT